MRNYTSPSLTSLLLATLASGRNVKRFRDILYEKELNKRTKASISVALSRLQARRLVSLTDSAWSITMYGRKEIAHTMIFAFIPNPFNEKEPHTVILSFDIPEKDRIKRNWLRNQIKIFGYKMLQQSLWIGPGPLPPVFSKRLEEMAIRKHVKTFKISKKK